MDTFEKFEALALEKKQTIINTAMSEFVKGGYEKASVNNIVEAAGISKGSLFYYFKNKKRMYLYLFEYIEQLIVNNVREQHYENEPDFIRRIRKSMLRNIDLLSTNPLAYAFMKSCKQEKSESVRLEIMEIKQKSTDEIYSGLYKNIDKSLFKDEINPDQAIYTIKATLFSIVHEFMPKGCDNPQDVKDRLEEYYRFFKTAYYK